MTHIINLNEDDFMNINYLKTEYTAISEKYFYSISSAIMKKLRPNLYAETNKAILVLEQDNISIECSLSPCVENNINIYWFDCYLDENSINTLLEIKEKEEQKEFDIPFC